MNSNKKRIAAKNLPMRLPLWSGITAWLLLDRLNAPGYAYGIVFTIIGVVAIGALIEMFTCDTVDIFEDGH